MFYKNIQLPIKLLHIPHNRRPLKSIFHSAAQARLLIVWLSWRIVNFGLVFGGSIRKHIVTEKNYTRWQFTMLFIFDQISQHIERFEVPINCNLKNAFFIPKCVIVLLVYGDCFNFVGFNKDKYPQWCFVCQFIFRFMWDIHLSSLVTMGKNKFSTYCR